MSPDAGGEQADCPGCGKPLPLCVCAELVQLDNRIEVLVLRHPREQDKALGTAGLLCRQLSRATLRTEAGTPAAIQMGGRGRWTGLGVTVIPVTRT